MADKKEAKRDYGKEIDALGKKVDELSDMVHMMSMLLDSMKKSEEQKVPYYPTFPDYSPQNPTVPPYTPTWSGSGTTAKPQKQYFKECQYCNRKFENGGMCIGDCPHKFFEVTC